MVTYTTVIGRLTKDPEQYRVGEKEVTKVILRVASNENRRDPVTQGWVEGEQLFVNVNCWRVLGQNSTVLRKGDPVIVHGRLRSREWTNQQGERRSTMEIDATAVGPDLTKCVVSSMNRLRADPPPAVTQSGAPDPDGERSSELTEETFAGTIAESLTGGEQRIPESV